MTFLFYAKNFYLKYSNWELEFGIKRSAFIIKENHISL